MTSEPLDVAALKARVAQGWRPHFLYFWGHTERGGDVTKACLSQWYPAPFVVDGRRFETAEHFMMFEKARLFGDHETAERIVAAPSPREVKALGRVVRGFDDARWVAGRFDIVVRGNLAKFSQNPALKSFLLGTGESVLVEASPYDRIWGIGLAEKDAAARTPEGWRGANLLGFALMRVRGEIREG